MPRDDQPCVGSAHRGKKKKKEHIQVEGQQFRGRAFPWCTAPRQLRRPVNTPVTDVIMALLRYRTTRSFCWTKTSLSPRWPADPDTTPAGSDVTFIWADVQLTFDVPGGGAGLARGWHGEPCSIWRTVATMTLTLESSKSPRMV